MENQLFFNNYSQAWERLIIFFLLIFILFFLEIKFPKRPLNSPKILRRVTNFGLSFFNILILKFLIPFSLISASEKAKQLNFGIFNIFSISQSLEIIFSLVIFDFFIYLQHLSSHKFFILWKLHLVHHSDTDLDVSSATRFHSLEIVLSFFYKSIIIFLLGPSKQSIIYFEILLNAMAMFNHSNISIPNRVDQFLRKLIVTPDMHRIHHSINQSEHHKNFGFNLSIWDYLFKTYKSFPDLGHFKMRIGLNSFREQKYISILSLLKMPFIKEDHLN